MRYETHYQVMFAACCIYNFLIVPLPIWRFKSLKSLGRSHMEEILKTQTLSPDTILFFLLSFEVTWPSSLLCAHPMPRMFLGPNLPYVLIQFHQNITHSNLITRMSLITAGNKKPSLAVTLFLWLLLLLYLSPCSSTLTYCGCSFVVCLLLLPLERIPWKLEFYPFKL